MTRRELAKAITLIESTRPEDEAAAERALRDALPASGKAWRVAVSGVPGVGKSTFIEALGWLVAERGMKVAVLAIDPSSPVSGGSILGDKTRMEKLATHPNAFIRPTPAGGALGGVARKTREAVLLCEAAGYQLVLIETVGVGQSEVDVASLSDLFLLLMLPGAGDSLQGIKRGIMELADMIAVNKADGPMKPLADQARRELESALALMPAGQETPVHVCSALDGTGVAEIWQAIADRLTFESLSGQTAGRRQRQIREWLRRVVEERVLGTYWSQPGALQAVVAATEDVAAGRITPYDAVKRMLSEA
jgi:LAO/AO transport system kinase